MKKFACYNSKTDFAGHSFDDFVETNLQESMTFEL